MSDDSLRKILAQNIKLRRKELHMTQARLAEYADISEPYINDLERCQSWVSDKVLLNIAEALHTEAHVLLTPHDSNNDSQPQHIIEEQTYNVIHDTKKDLYKKIDSSIELAIRQVTAMYSGRDLPQQENEKYESTEKASDQKPLQKKTRGRKKKQ